MGRAMRQHSVAEHSTVIWLSRGMGMISIVMGTTILWNLKIDLRWTIGGTRPDALILAETEFLETVLAAFLYSVTLVR